MVKTVLISISPMWLQMILSGKKTVELRKTIPSCGHPFRVLFYCTKSGNSLTINGYQVNGYVVASAICERSLEIDGFDSAPEESCVSKEYIEAYAKGGQVCAWYLSDIKLIRPRDIAYYGLKRAPQSWCYVRSTDIF